MYETLRCAETGPPAAADLDGDLSPQGYRVEVQPCDPTQWEDPETRKQGQAFDGNGAFRVSRDQTLSPQFSLTMYLTGFVWKPERVELLGGLQTFWLSTTPEQPGGPAWDASPYQRTGFRTAPMPAEITCTLLVTDTHPSHIPIEGPSDARGGGTVQGPSERASVPLHLGASMQHASCTVTSPQPCCYAC